jgi:hypothetical protein
MSYFASAETTQRPLFGEDADEMVVDVHEHIAGVTVDPSEFYASPIN